MKTINNKETIDELTSHIISIEDEIKELEKTLISKSQIKFNIPKFSTMNISNELEKNKATIDSLNKMKKTDYMSYELELNSKENEKLIIYKQIKDIENKLNSSEVKEVNNNSANDNEIYNSEKVKISVAKERKKIESEISILKNNLILLRENLAMLYEEKKTIENEIVNIISHKESLEDYLKNFSLLINEQNSNLLSTDHFEELNFECFSFEISIINKTIYCENLSNFLSEKINININTLHAFKTLCFNNLEQNNTHSLCSSENLMIFCKKIYEFILHNSDTNDIQGNTNKIDLEVNSY